MANFPFIESMILNGGVLALADAIYPVPYAQAMSSWRSFFLQTLLYGVPLMMVSGYMMT